jgi:uncharacterized protein (TIGR03083 family)
MDREEIWAAIDAHRLQVDNLLDQLSEDEWKRPSLCDGWTVRDVAAHLTLQQLTWRQAISIMVTYRGDTNRGIHETARKRAAALTTAQIVAELRAMIGSHRHNAGVSYRETLIDALVHGQDIAVPLNRTLTLDPAAAAEATTRMWTMRFPPPFPATKAMKEYRLVATDVDWSAGSGAEVRAPITAIMLVASGRLVAVPRLSGPGAESLANRLRGA